MRRRNAGILSGVVVLIPLKLYDVNLKKGINIKHFSIKKAVNPQIDRDVPRGGLRMQKNSNECSGTEKDKPLVTVITVVRNGDKYLEQTIESVLSQTYGNIEYIIIDGASTDRTIEIIKKYDNDIDYWISEPDHGVSDAFNKGIAYASGEWINFLNAGDLYAGPNTLSELSQYFSKAPIVTAFVKHGRISIPKYCHRNEEALCVKAMISHQGSFIRKDIFSVVGMFSADFSIRMDYEFWLRALKKYTFFFVNDVIIHYDAGLSAGNIRKFYREEIQANTMHGLPFICSLKAYLKLIVKKYLFFNP